MSTQLTPLSADIRPFRSRRASDPRVTVPGQGEKFRLLKRFLVGRLRPLRKQRGINKDSQVGGVRLAGRLECCWC